MKQIEVNTDTFETIDHSVRFLSKMTASSTHEIKNTLAIINENAGLLEDLVLLNDKGGQYLADRVASISKRIQKQVKRSDNIVKNLNQFSHSMDKSSDFIDLNEVIDFIVNFGSRLLQIRCCSVNIEKNPSVQKIQSPLFHLQHLIWRIIETLCYDKNKQITIITGVKKQSTTPYLRFSTKEINSDIINQVIESEYNQFLMDCVGVKTVIDNTHKHFDLNWTK